jgi:hypothetical protein
VDHHGNVGIAGGLDCDSYSLFRLGSIPVTSGMVMIPFVFGISIIFYNAKNLLGWLLAGSSLVMLSFGVISSINFRMRSMPAFELIMILVLMIGGFGLFLRSLRSLGTS